MYVVPAVLAINLLLDPGAFAVRSPPPGETSESSIVWSEPPKGIDPALSAWHGRYVQQARPVLTAWNRMLRRLRGELPARFAPQCTGLVSSLERLDETVILPAPDRLIDFYLRRLLLHLRAAATACSRQELWTVVYRLEEARSNLAEMRWLLEVKGLD